MRSATEDKHWLNNAVVIGDGPGGLAYAISLWLARSHDPDFTLTVIGERSGKYSREQGLRIEQSLCLYILEELTSIVPDETGISGINRQVQSLLGKRSGTEEEIRPYFKAHRSSGLTRSLNDPTALALFHQQHYLSVEIKHLEQLLFHRLVQLTAGDPRCRFIFKKRDEEVAPLGAIKHIAADGAITLAVDDTPADTIHPDALFALDGARSSTRGVVAHINDNLPPDARIKIDTYTPPSLLHQAHSVGTYDTTAELDDYLLHNYSGDRLRRSRRQINITQPPLTDFIALGWREPHFPIARIIPLKKGLYIGVQTPSSLLSIADEADKRKALMQWHMLVLQRILPIDLITHLTVKGTGIRSKDDPTKADEDRARRERREQLRIAGFEIVFTPGVKKPVTTLSEKTLLVPGGDALNGYTVNYQTAQGALSALLGALALKYALEKSSAKAEFIHLYAGRIRDIKAGKDESNSTYSEHELENKREAEDEITTDLLAAISGGKNIVDRYSSFPVLNASIINNDTALNLFNIRSPRQSPLRQAALLGQIETVQYFVNLGGDLSKTDHNGNDIFYSAVVSGLWTADQLQAVFGEPTAAMLNQGRTITLLSTVIQLNNRPMTTYLLDKGADPAATPNRISLHPYAYQFVGFSTQWPVDLLSRLCIKTDLNNYVEERVSPELFFAMTDRFNTASTETQIRVLRYLAACQHSKQPYLAQFITQLYNDNPAIPWFRTVVSSDLALPTALASAVLQADIPEENKLAIIQQDKVFFNHHIRSHRSHRSIASAIVVMGYLTDTPMPRRCLPMLCGGPQKLAANRRQLVTLRQLNTWGNQAETQLALQGVIDISPKSALAKKLTTWLQVPSKPTLTPLY
ncbi:MAG: hypothetical protein P1U40_04180 [Coxiellaceae bacterium]|nr:hypothetical protein [Coxiellaceae bacterium]